MKLSDFGIARAEADASLTATGLVTGSPAYIAPEVASGRLATGASDVWSLGATAFHALTGRPPYDVGDNVLGALYRIVHEEPPRLEDGGWLTPFVSAAMTRDPALRWTMGEVSAFLRAEGTRPRPPPRTPAFTPVAHAAGRRRALDPGDVGAGVRAAPEPLLPLPPPDGATAPRRARCCRSWSARARLIAGGHGRSPAAQQRPERTTRARDPSTCPSSGDDPDTSRRPPRAAMTTFVDDYLATADDDPAAGFALLTPELPGRAATACPATKASGATSSTSGSTRSTRTSTTSR